MPTPFRPVSPAVTAILPAILRLPEKLGPWRRARDAEDLAAWGIPTAPFLQALADAEEAPGVLYFHPACRHFHAWIPASIDAADALQFRRVGAPGAPSLRAPFSLLDLQRMQELRDCLHQIMDDEDDHDVGAFADWALASRPQSGSARSPKRP